MTKIRYTFNITNVYLFFFIHIFIININIVYLCIVWLFHYLNYVIYRVWKSLISSEKLAFDSKSESEEKAFQSKKKIIIVGVEWNEI